MLEKGAAVVEGVRCGDGLGADVTIGDDTEGDLEDLGGSAGAAVEGAIAEIGFDAAPATPGADDIGVGANIFNGEVFGDGSTMVSAGVETDSRLIGEGFLFVAKPGEHTDGHLFVEAAHSQGATVAMVERKLESSITQIVVKDVVVALGLLATAVLAKLRESGHLTVIGVTGSNGKTSTKNMLGAVLAEFGAYPAVIQRELDRYLLQLTEN